MAVARRARRAALGARRTRKVTSQGRVNREPYLPTGASQRHEVQRQGKWRTWNRGEGFKLSRSAPDGSFTCFWYKCPQSGCSGCKNLHVCVVKGCSGGTAADEDAGYTDTEAEQLFSVAPEDFREASEATGGWSLGGIRRPSVQRNLDDATCRRSKPVCWISRGAANPDPA